MYFRWTSESEVQTAVQRIVTPKHPHDFYQYDNYLNPAGENSKG